MMQRFDRGWFKPLTVSFCCLFHLALVLMASPANAQAPYRDDANNWQMTIPKGWQIGPKELVDATNIETAKRQPDSRAVFLVSLVPEGSKLPTPIYVLAQFNPLSLRNVPFDQIKQSLGVDFPENAESTIKQGFSDVVSSVKFDTPIFDDARNRWISTSVLNLPNGEIHRIMTVGVLMKNGILHLYCYAPQDSFPVHAPTFAQMADSIQIDASHAFVPYQPTDHTKNKPKAPEKSSSPSLLFMGFPLFLLAFVVFYLITKRKKYTDA